MVDVDDGYVADVDDGYEVDVNCVALFPSVIFCPVLSSDARQNVLSLPLFFRALTYGKLSCLAVLSIP